MKFFVRKKEYDAVKRVLDACKRALNREHEKCEMIAKEKEEERHRAEHFQARCEAYEDAARNAGFEFVSTPNGFVLERLTDAQHPETFWARLKKWP